MMKTGLGKQLRFSAIIATVQVAVLVSVAVLGVKWALRPAPPARGSCRDAVTRADTMLKAPIQPMSTTNVAGRTLLRIRASRPELSIFDAPNGNPDLTALMQWAATVPDISSLAMASCSRSTSALAASLGIALPADGLPLLASLLAWMEQRTPSSTEFTHVESNRNIIFAIHTIARKRLLPEWRKKHASAPSANEVMTWARTRPVSDRSYDELWSLLLRLELNPSA